MKHCSYILILCLLLSACKLFNNQKPSLYFPDNNEIIIEENTYKKLKGNRENIIMSLGVIHNNSVKLIFTGTSRHKTNFLEKNCSLMQYCY